MVDQSGDATRIGDNDATTTMQLQTVEAIGGTLNFKGSSREIGWQSEREEFGQGRPERLQ